MANTETLSPADENELRATYLQVSHNLNALVDAYDQQKSCSDIAKSLRDLFEQCPSMRTPRELEIANECVSVPIRLRLGSDYGQEILDAVEKGLSDVPDDLESEWESFDYNRFLLFFLGIVVHDDPAQGEEFIENLLDRIDSVGSLNDLTDMGGQEDNTVFEVLGYLSLFTHEELPDWARLRILLRDSTALLPDERSKIATGLVEPTSLICANLGEICENVIAYPDKYEPRFAEALRAFVMDNLTLTADFLETELGDVLDGDVLDDLRASRDAMSDSFALESSKKLYTG